MSKYKVISSDGEEIKSGDTVTNFRGEKAEFIRVSCGPLPGKSAKVIAKNAHGTRELYAEVFGLTVMEV
jgi:hypothetical protein